MIWGYGTIPLLAVTYGNKSDQIRTPRILNWVIYMSPSFERLKDIILGWDYEVVGVLEPTDAERDYLILLLCREYLIVTVCFMLDTLYSLMIGVRDWRMMIVRGQRMV